MISHVRFGVFFLENHRNQLDAKVLSVPTLLVMYVDLYHGFQHVIMIISLIQFMDFISCLYIWSTISREFTHYDCCWIEKSDLSNEKSDEMKSNGSDLKHLICLQQCLIYGCKFD